jgi:hypothetical protein
VWLTFRGQRRRILHRRFCRFEIDDLHSRLKRKLMSTAFAECVIVPEET